jgi:integrase
VLGLDLHEASRWLRGRDDDPERYPGDLRRADVTRRELFERSATRMPIRLHDLRATFVTVSLANGETEQWVTDRTGHTSSQILVLYTTRQARTWSELALGLLSPLDALLQEYERPSRPRRRSRRGPRLAPACPPGLGIVEWAMTDLNCQPTD